MKAPRYFCENCGAEVKRDAKVCPECGRFFASVKCPQCGHIGQVDEFVSGCPVCGYSDPAKGNAAQTHKVSTRPQGNEGQPLPLWTYLASFLGLCLVLILLALSFR
jgi:predicted amidophosphoribosyltransferase